MEKSSKAAWKTKHSWCIIASMDRMIDPALERAKARIIVAKALELRTSQVPMVSEPEKVAALIIEAARDLPEHT